MTEQPPKKKRKWSIKDELFEATPQEVESHEINVMIWQGQEEARKRRNERLLQSLGARGCESIVDINGLTARLREYIPPTPEERRENEGQIAYDRAIGKNLAQTALTYGNFRNTLETYISYAPRQSLGEIREFAMGQLRWVKGDKLAKIMEELAGKIKSARQHAMATGFADDVPDPATIINPETGKIAPVPEGILTQNELYHFKKAVEAEKKAEKNG